MTKTEYADYCKDVAAFMKSEGIKNLSRIYNDSDPSFGYEPCECCNRPFGGDRIDASGYNPTTKEIQEYSICVDCEYYAEYGRLDDMTMMEIEK